MTHHAIQSVRIRFAAPDDLPQILEIEQQSFFDSQWSAADLSAHECRVAEASNRIVGFLISREIAAADLEGPAEREILNLAVRPEWRRRGVARALLAEELKAQTVYYLEVRESNVNARALYRGYGFLEIGRRSDYYQNPNEPAIVMRRK